MPNYGKLSEQKVRNIVHVDVVFVFKIMAMVKKKKKNIYSDQYNV